MKRKILKLLSVFLLIAICLGCGRQETAATLSDKYVDFDNMSFELDGHVYTVGQSTLQDMIDNKCYLTEDSTSSTEDILSPGDMSRDFYVIAEEKEAGERYWEFYLQTTNLSDEDKKAKDCTISLVYFNAKENPFGERIKFAFPLDITENDLVTQAGEPTLQETLEQSDVRDNLYHYDKDMEDSDMKKAYTFDFVSYGDDKFALNDLYMQYMRK